MEDEQKLNVGISRRKLLKYGVYGSLAAGLPTGLWGGGCSRKDERPKQSCGKVFLFAIDGLCWQILEPLLAKGDLPNFSRLINGGVCGELATIIPTVSPVIWTSIATGKSPAKHGITGFWYRRESGQISTSPAEKAQIQQLKALGYIGGDTSDKGSMAMYDRTLWRAKALWNILSKVQMSSRIFGWWMTYPAEPISGCIVSDRYLFNRFELKARTEKGLIYDNEKGHVFPPELEQRVRPLVMSVNDVTANHMQQFIDGPVELSGPLSLHNAEDELRIVYAKDESFIRMARIMLAEEVPNLFAVYVQGTDIVSHYFWKYRFPDQWEQRYPSEPISESERKRYSQTINEYYKLQDRHLGEFLKYADEQTTIIVCSDHGFIMGRRSPTNHPIAAKTISGIHNPYAPPGVIIMSGCGINKGIKITGAHIYDITPTILTLFGLPLGADMDGKVLVEALVSGLKARKNNRRAWTC